MNVDPNDIVWDDEPQAEQPPQQAMGTQPAPADDVQWDAEPGQDVATDEPPAPAPTLSVGGVDALRAAHPDLDFTDDGQVVLKDAGGITGMDTGIIGEKGGFHTERNERMAGGNTAVNAMLKAGASKGDILKYLTSRNPSWTQADLLSISQQIDKIKAWQADPQNRKFKGDFYVDVEHKQVPNNAWENFSNSDTGVGAISAADAASGFNSDSIIGAAGGDAEGARANLDAAQAAHPKAAATGTVLGGVGGSIALEGALAKAGAKGLAKTVGADVGYGLTAGAGATDTDENGNPATLEDRAIGAAKGAAASVAGRAAGEAVALTGRAAANATKDANVARINAEGIPTTVGQQYTGKLGGIIKRTEDRIAGLPILGDIINARRVEGIKKFNQRVYDHTLEPIGTKIEGRIGEEAVDYAQDKISEAYNAALKGKSVGADKQFATDLTSAITGVKSLPRVGDEVADNIRVILEPYMNGTAITGEAMQQMSRELRDLKAGYVTDPLKKRIGGEIDKVENAIFGPFRRQTPEVLPAYNKAKVAQRRLYIVADAVNKAKNREGIFMPHQLGTADRTAAIKSGGKVNAARGRGQFHDIQRAAQNVLPSSIPDSGTAGRVILPAVALGVGGGSDAAGLSNGAGTTLAAVLTLAYSRAGQRLLTKPGRGMNGAVGRALKSDKTRRALTRAGAASGAVAVAQ